VELTNQTPESHAAAAGVLTLGKAPTPAENVRRLVEKGPARVPGSHPLSLALRLGGVS